MNDDTSQSPPQPPSEEGTVAALGVTTILAEDKRSAALRFTVNGTTMWATATDTASIEAVIGELGKSRGQMVEPVADDLAFDVVRPLAAFNPRWHLLPDTTNRFVTFWIRHPGLGWSGYGFPRDEAAKIARFLPRIPAINTAQEKLASLPKEASSFGGENFLLTSAGLGFYYYGEGERRIGPNPFDQVEYDSDRAAGIVAGSIVERRLEEAIKSAMRSDRPEIFLKLFRPSGALGPFSNKIDLAYLLNVISPEAYKDLTNLKNIRNDFAHELELDTFDRPTIKDRCANFVIVDRHVGPVPDAPQDATAASELVSRPSPYFGLPDFKEKIVDPRFRYIMTSQLLSSALGEGANNPSRKSPLI